MPVGSAARHELHGTALTPRRGRRRGGHGARLFRSATGARRITELNGCHNVPPSKQRWGEAERIAYSAESSKQLLFCGPAPIHFGRLVASGAQSFDGAISFWGHLLTRRALLSLDETASGRRIARRRRHQRHETSGRPEYRASLRMRHSFLVNEHLLQWADPLFARRCQPVFNRLPAGEPVHRLSQRLDALAVELWRKNPHP